MCHIKHEQQAWKHLGELQHWWLLLGIREIVFTKLIKKKKTFKCSLLRDKSEKEKNNRELSRTCNLELSETSDRQVVIYKEESY